MKRSKIILQSGKTYTYNGTEGAYTVILGELAAGDTQASSGSASPVIAVNDGPPSNSLTGSVTTYIDKSSKKIYIRSSGTWDSGTSMTGSIGATGATGAAGSNGADGKSVRFGSGAPASGLGSDNEVYIDTSNFRIHTKSAGSWSAGSLFKGGDGINGSNGVNGKSVRFGSGAPASGLGDDDEVYIDTSSFKIHTKASGVWSGGSLFKGGDGANGVDGSSVRFGSGAPSAGLGSNNDVYIDIDSFKIHTKSAGSWSGGALFKGSDGVNGSNGADGKSVRFGSGAPASGLGSDDEVYIDTSSFKIHTKTSGTWSAGSLFKGETGSTGAPGPQGIQGAAGSKGDKGDTGAGVQVYSVALGASNSSSDVELGVALTGMQFQDVLTNEGSILTASTSGGVTTLTITNTGRYKFDLQASIKATGGGGYAPTVTAEIYNVTTASSLISGSLSLTPAVGTPDTDVIELKRIFRIAAGTQIRVRAKTDNAGSTAAQKSYLVLSDKSSSETADDTVLTITKL